MQRTLSLILLTALILCACPEPAGSAVFEYPSVLLDSHRADGSCWKGMDASGAYPATVVPTRWLVGPPLSEESAVTLPADWWLDLGFSGGLADGDGDDILLTETGKAGEQALLFVTDGADREYLLTRVEIEPVMRQELSHVGIDFNDLVLPFVPRAIRVVGLDLGGQSPGFDLSCVVARLSHDCGARAGYPHPVSGARKIEPDAWLTWVPACSADRQAIYLSDRESLVRTGAAAARRATLPGDANTYDPSGLELGRTYFWRVDGLGPADANLIDAGDIWSFTVADHVVVDDFEEYVYAPSLSDVWQITGWAGLVLEPQVLDTCQHSMVFNYYYDSTTGSKVSRHFREPWDWTQGGTRVLQLLIQGDLPNPSGGELYIALTDGVREQLVTDLVVMEIGTNPLWRTCRIALERFDEIDLTRVCGVTIGTRAAAALGPGASHRGTLSIAEIGLYGAVCPEGSRPAADLAGDCVVDYRDLQQMAADWLSQPARVLEVATPREPVLWYEFENNADDLTGRAHGQIRGRCNFVPGVCGQAIHFMGQDDAVVIPDAAGVFAGIHEAITIAFWQQGEDSGHRNDTLLCSNFEYGRSNPALAIHLGCWHDPGHYRWDCGFPWSFDNRLAGEHRDKAEWTGRWNHWAFTKDIHAGPDGRKGRMEVYLNGELYGRLTGADAPITGISSLQIGSGWYGYYDGLIDDLQIYDYALSPAEIAYVATDGSGIFERPPSPADLNLDEAVDFRDFANLAMEWLQDGLWP